MMSAALGIMIFTQPSAAVGAMIDGAHGAVQLSLNLLALYAFWLGFFSLIEKLGLSRGLERLLRPVIKRLFPSCNTETRRYIAMNMSANLLGLGNAATPMAMKAIKGMDDGSGKATVDMIMLTVISATSLQILPTTVIGMRASAGAVNAADFLFPSLIATVLSTLIGIVGVKICSKIFDGKHKSKKTAAHGTNVTQTAAQPLTPHKQKRLARKERKASARLAHNTAHSAAPQRVTDSSLDARSAKPQNVLTQSQTRKHSARLKRKKHNRTTGELYSKTPIEGKNN